MSLAIRPAPDGCIVPVRVHPGAKRNAIAGVHDGALKVSLTTPPTDGKANAALIAFMAERLHVPRAQISLLTGATSRSKTLHITGITSSEAEAKLLSDFA